MTNPDKVERLRELLGKATEGPWRISERGNEVASSLHGGSHIVCAVDMQWGENRRADNAALIVEAINALPALLAVVEALEPFAAALRDNGETWEPDRITIDHARAARTALATLKGES